MNTQNLYPIVEIRKHSIKFEVIKFYKDQVIIIFEKTYYGDGSDLLTSQGAVKDPSLVSKFLEQSFNNFDQTFKNLKLKDVGLILPNNISIIKKTIDYDLGQQEAGKLKNLANLKLILKKSEKLYDNNKITQNFKILDNKISELIVDNQQIDLNNLANLKFNNQKLAIVLSMIAINKQVYESHEKTISKINKKIMWSKPKIFTLHEMITDESKNHKIIIDWRYSEIEIGVFQNAILSKVVKLPFGVEQIVYEISQFMDTDLNLASKYIFNNIDFSSENLTNIKVFSKWNKKTNTLDVITADKLKTKIEQEIQKIYQQIKNTLLETKQQNYHIYNFGIICKIPGIKTVICTTECDDVRSKSWIGDFIVGGDSCSLVGLARFVSKNPIHNSDDLLKNEEYQTS
ncbi:hypothetical protein [Mycoplasma putrefaciens]|uniref:SHS2 domain-containing protein n=2 Tax=Mycoplasma putrefaciens TaxID=2123 RepID=M9WCL5_9MOLU|nr:hypothetical protein [Mycoplasma putrefaciens]AEM68665.1 uncharacterized protein MPUT_0287 [Mycoplasma putrefaciens KS1]AGJ90872.1 Hypothetical protein MPUT9231_4620 [Mycoplasma putrefaciens Mput9231]